MASSKRSRAPRSKSSPAQAPKTAAPRRATDGAKGSSPASAILAEPAPTKGVTVSLLAPAPAPEVFVSLPEPVAAAPAREPAPAPVVAAPPSAEAAPRPMSLEERRELVAKLAYFRAKDHGFGRTNPVEDWLWAEQEVSRRMMATAA